MPLKVHVYSVMRNEARLLPYFLRHYETVAERIFVWDDQTDDGTTEMLKDHPLVTLLPLKHHGADDVYYVKYLWPQYVEHSRGVADWVLCVDADEFAYHPTLAERLAQLREEGVRRVRLDGYTMYSPVFPTTTGQIYEEVQHGWLDKWSTKTVLFDPALKMSWTPGRHFCIPQRTVPTVKDSGINLLHFRYMGPDYFLARNMKNAMDMNLKFSMRKNYNLPDGSRGIPYAWYESRKDKLVRLVGNA